MNIKNKVTKNKKAITMTVIYIDRKNRIYNIH